MSPNASKLERPEAERQIREGVKSPVQCFSLGGSHYSVLLVFHCVFLVKLKRRKLLEIPLPILFISVTQTVGRIHMFVYVPCTEFKRNWDFWDKFLSFK